jgi:hypothetical protein
VQNKATSANEDDLLERAMLKFDLHCFGEAVSLSLAITAAGK